MTQTAFLGACRDTIGAAQVLTDPHDTAPYLTDWRRRYTGAACAVLCPATPDEVAALVKLAVEHRIAQVAVDALGAVASALDRHVDLRGRSLRSPQWPDLNRSNWSLQRTNAAPSVEP